MSDDWNVQQEKEMEEILRSTGCSNSILERFKSEKVYPATVKLLTDAQLQELGIELMGDRAFLRDASTRSACTRSVMKEVQQILKPLPVGAKSTYVDRRPKRKSKLKIVESTYGTPRSGKGGNKPPPTFQKKIVVVEYMGETPPKRFGLKESNVVVRGMLPNISLTATEKEVRTHICEVISSDKMYACCGENDFEFLEANGRSVCVPAKLSSFTWNGKAVKSLSGTGAVYVRFIVNPEVLTSSSSSSDSETEEKSGVNKIIKIDSDDDDISLPRILVTKKLKCNPPSTSGAQLDSPTRSNQIYLPCTQGGRSSTNDLRGTIASSIGKTHSDHCTPYTGTANCESLSTQTSSPTPPRASSPSTPSLLSYYSEQPGSSYHHEEATAETPSQDQLEQLLVMFPSVPPDGVKFLFKLSNNNAVVVSECLINFTVEGVLDLVQAAILRDSPKRLRLDEEDWESDENLAESLVTFYKDYKFNSHAAIHVCIPNQPVLDSGGVRRHLFSRVLATMAKSDKFGLFEGPPGRLRPTFRQSSVSSGMLHILGRMIGHSIVMDRQGFPFLSPPCYYYMCGCLDKALSLVQLEDVGERINHVIEQVNDVQEEGGLDGLECKDVMLDLLEQCGSDIPISMENREALCESIIRYDVLQKRKVYLDSIAEGLDEFGVLSAMKCFPELFSDLFVPSTPMVAKDVLEIMEFPDRMAEEERVVAGFVEDCVDQLSQCELEAFVKHVTGSPYTKGNRIYVHFDSHRDASAFVANTCGRQLTLSTLISDVQACLEGIQAIITSNTFTMP